VREQAVQRVLESQHGRDEQYLAVCMVAQDLGLVPQALATWVRHAERARWEAADFGVAAR
jgi:transposase-like protein